MYQLFAPKKIVASKNVLNTEVLLKKKKIHKNDLQVAWAEKSVITIGDEGGYIILDFGKEMCGGIIISTFLITSTLKTPFLRTAKIRVRFGESLTETLCQLGEKNSTNHHSVRDEERLITGLSTISIGNTGYRFVRIDFYSGFGEVQIKSIVGTNTILNIPAEFTYNGNDADVKKIFNVAKRTIDLCSGSGLIWDGIKRDRLVWIGDLYPEMLSLTSLYGQTTVLENSLVFERERAKFKDIWFCTLNTYNAWFVISCCDYYLRTDGKYKDFILHNLEYLNEQIKLFLKYVDNNGEMNVPDYTRFFVDWPCSDCDEDVKAGARFIFMIAADKMRQVLKLLGKDCTDAEKLYNYLNNGDKSVKYKKQVIGLKYIATGEISDEEYGKLILNRTQGFSTFMSYPILTAIASRDKNLAITFMKEYYGAMIDKGATTFWEDFDVSWVNGSCGIDVIPEENEKDIHGDFGSYCYKGFRHSLCHAWSSGVIAFIKEYC